MARRRTRAPAPGGPDPRLRALYAAAPAEFVAARDALARALASEGSPDAARVGHLRRPTLAVWLMNAVARERPDVIAALFAAGDRLRQAQPRAVRGDAGELRLASAAVQEAVAAGLAAACEIAAAKGRATGGGALDEVMRSLRAVATADMASRGPLQRAVLEQLPKPGGIELLTGLAAVKRPADAAREARHLHEAPAPAAARGVPHDHGAERSRRAAERSARAEAARRGRERREAEAAAERNERALRAAAERVRAAERELEEAERHLAAAREDAQAARDASVAARARADAARRHAPA